MKARRQSRVCLAAMLLTAALFGVAARARAEMAILLEEPYGRYGEINPTGHAAVYLSRVCAASPTKLRRCAAGETGVVLSRYYKVGGYDWLAMPLVPYLYAVDSLDAVPKYATPEKALQLRDDYRRAHLRTLVPDGPDGARPEGEWVDMLGAGYIRKIYGLRVKTTEEQDNRFIALYNDRTNASHFNLVYENCANFSRDVVDLYFPHAVRRNVLGDAGVMTPRQVARSVLRYGRKHPDLAVSAFVIPQWPGSIPRSRKTRGIAEGFVKSKKYIVPLTLILPELGVGIAVDYMAEDRFAFPKNAEVLSGPAVVESLTEGGTVAAQAKPAGTQTAIVVPVKEQGQGQ